MNKNILVRIFQALADTINGGEKAFVDFLSAIVPYLVPIVPSYLTYWHTLTIMGFPDWVAWTSAIVVETLGLASVSTSVKFWYHNKKYSNNANKAPFRLAIGVYIFYIVTVITVNVLLEIEDGTRNNLVIFCIALFSLLSFPSGVLISIRAQYREVLDSIEQRYHKPSAPVSAPAPSGTLREKHASDYRDKIIGLLDAEYGKSGGVLAPKDISVKLRLNHANSKGYISTLTKEWKRGKGIS